MTYETWVSSHLYVGDDYGTVRITQEHWPKLCWNACTQIDFRFVKTENRYEAFLDRFSLQKYPENQILLTIFMLGKHNVSNMWKYFVERSCFDTFLNFDGHLKSFRSSKYYTIDTDIFSNLSSIFSPKLYSRSVSTFRVMPYYYQDSGIFVIKIHIFRWLKMIEQFWFQISTRSEYYGIGKIF